MLVAGFGTIAGLLACATFRPLRWCLQAIPAHIFQCSISAIELLLLSLSRMRPWVRMLVLLSGGCRRSRRFSLHVVVCGSSLAWTRFVSRPLSVLLPLCSHGGRLAGSALPCSVVLVLHLLRLWGGLAVVEAALSRWRSVCCCVARFSAVRSSSRVGTTLVRGAYTS